MTSRAIFPAALLCALAMPGSGWAREDVRADSPFAGGDDAAAVRAWERETLGSAMLFPALPDAVERGRFEPGAGEPGSAQGKRAKWTAHVAFELNGQIDLYASYATGRKASSVNLSRGTRPFGLEQVFLDAAGAPSYGQASGARFARPEDTKVYEIGMRADWGKANFNLALFQQSITGSQSTLLVGSAFVLAQAGRETVRGAEFEASVRPARGLVISGAFTYLDARYESYAVSAAGNLAGMRPAGIPSLSATVGAAREWRLAGGGRLILRGNFHYESPTQIQQAVPGVAGAQPAFGQVPQDMASPALDSLLVASARNERVVGGATSFAAPFRAGVREVGASLTWVVRRGLDFTLWGRNIANDRYRVTVHDADERPITAYGYANQPRAFGGTVRLRL